MRQHTETDIKCTKHEGERTVFIYFVHIFQTSHISTLYTHISSFTYVINFYIFISCDCYFDKDKNTACIILVSLE